jgi:uncharacterized coiled-coil DUF342 family protein
LEATVAELRAALEKAKQNSEKAEALADLKDSLEESQIKESYLQQQIVDLQSELQHQKEFLHKMQKDLENSEKLKTELEQAKKAAIQLAAANEKLTQEVDTLKKENEGLKAQGHQELEQYHIPERPIQEQYHIPERPIQKEADNPGDFAKNSWLL